MISSTLIFSALPRETLQAGAGRHACCKSAARHRPVAYLRVTFWNSVVPFHLAVGWFWFLPQDVGIRRLIWIELLGLRVRRNEDDINAAVISQPGSAGIAHTLFRRPVGISALQVADRGFIERFLLAIR